MPELDTRPTNDKVRRRDRAVDVVRLTALVIVMFQQQEQIIIWYIHTMRGTRLGEVNTISMLVLHNLLQLILEQPEQTTGD